MEKLIIDFNRKHYEGSILKMKQAAKLVDSLLQAYKKFQDATEMKDLDLNDLKSILRGHRGAVELMIDNYVLEQKKPLQKHYAEACYTALSEHLDPVFRQLGILQEQANRVDCLGTFTTQEIGLLTTNWRWLLTRHSRKV